MTSRQSIVKLIFDTSLAGFGLLVLWPLLLVLALAVKLSSPGPAFFRHRRVGRGGAVILVLKLRTMDQDQPDGVLQVTVDGDPRVTPLGKHLRRHKLDELPQLWNVLRGEMSLVGPRPDVAGYADRLSGRDARILDLRPGITGPATLYFRDEEKMLANAPDPVALYQSVVYPLKVRIDIAYIETWSLWRDIGYIAVTAVPPIDRYLHLVPTPKSVATLRRVREAD